MQVLKFTSIIEYPDRTMRLYAIETSNYTLFNMINYIIL